MYNSILPTVISFNFHVIVHTALHDRAGTTASIYIYIYIYLNFSIMSQQCSGVSYVLVTSGYDEWTYLRDIMENFHYVS